MPKSGPLGSFWPLYFRYLESIFWNENGIEADNEKADKYDNYHDTNFLDHFHKLLEVLIFFNCITSSIEDLILSEY
jgi:hypothetical protein